MLDADTTATELLLQCREEKWAKKLQQATRVKFEERVRQGDTKDVKVTLDGTLLKIQFKTSGLQGGDQKETKKEAPQGRKPTVPSPEPKEEPVPR